MILETTNCIYSIESISGMKSKFNIQIDEIVIQTNCGKDCRNETCSLVRCPSCTKERLVRNAYIHSQRIKGIFTGQCVSCNAKKRNRKWSDGFHPSYKGHKKLTKDGYVSISLKSLRDTPDFDIAEKMSWSSGNIRRVLEHRLVMAKHISRPLEKHEIVHHKNGIKTDNRIENLELLTIKSHHKGHDDYRKNPKYQVAGVDRYCLVYAVSYILGVDPESILTDDYKKFVLESSENTPAIEGYNVLLKQLDTYDFIRFDYKQFAEGNFGFPNSHCILKKGNHVIVGKINDDKSIQPVYDPDNLLWRYNKDTDFDIILFVVIK